MAQFVPAFHYYILIFVKSTLYYDIVADFRTGLYKAALDHTVGLHDIDVCRSLFNLYSFIGHFYSIRTHIHQHPHFGKLTRQKCMIGVRHLRTNGECARSRVYKRRGEVNKATVGIRRTIGKRYCDIRIPFARIILLAEIDVAVFKREVVKRSQGEVDKDSIALYNCCQQRFAAGANKCADISAAL